MALIKCTECGKEFSDRAAACPNCGCPTDIILEDIEKEKSIQQKKIVASYDIGDYKFEIDSKMDYRIRLISDFCQKRDQIKILAGKMYDEFGNIDNVIEQMPQSFSIILEGAINAAIDLLMKNKIMECDVNYFISNYGEELDAASLMEPIIVEEAQFPRQIAITDKKIRWYNNDGKVYYCEWKDFVKHEVTTKLDGSVLWNGYYLFTSEIIDPLMGNRIKKLLTLISDNLQKESIDRVVQKNNTDTSSSEAVSEENSSDSACPANEIIDYSKSGDFKSLGCQKALDAMCQCLNSKETIETILKDLNTLAIDYSGCATRDVNVDLLYKVVEVRAASRYFDAEEEPLFYKDSAIMFYGKNGLLITNKAIYRIKKNGLRKILFSKMESLHLVDILNGRDECKWCFNGIREFDLDAIGIDSKWSGTIMALVCLLFKKNQPGKKIKFFNFV
mgnify:CR=1 FL=1